jgi:glycerol-3-phosphate acyltransferase PlsY
MTALALLLCYLVGSLPSAYLLVKWTKHVDIRTIGSGNVGATNALRAAGPLAGMVVLLIDVLKGWLAAAAIPRWILGLPSPALALGCGLAAVLGHVFPCFLRFRGGKGVATTLGALGGSVPVVAGIAVGVWVAVFLLSRYVSLGSLAAALAIPISQAMLHHSVAEILAGSVLAVLIIVRHRANIQRLLGGAEHRAWSGNS